MTLSLFEKYEIHRKRYNPGTIWKSKRGYRVQELVILPRDTPDVAVYRGFDELDASLENLVPFEITKSREQTQTSRFSSGRKLSWSQKYMEENYEPK